MLRFLSILFLSIYVVQEEPMMPWTNNYRLEWSDFKASPQQHADVIAVTASGLSFGYSTTRYSDGSIDYDFEITAHFYPEKSYYLKEHVTSLTLDHERLHFDITELHARKFRQRVSLTHFTQNIDKEMEVINREINEQLKQMQHRYDRETGHSRNMDRQLEWQKFIATELIKLDYYK